MFRFGVNSNYLIGKCISCIRKDNGGVSGRKYARVLDNSNRKHRKSAPNLSILKDHVQLSSLNSICLKMAANYSRYLLNSKIWDFEDINRELQNISNELSMKIKPTNLVKSTNCITQSWNEKCKENISLNTNRDYAKYRRLEETKETVKVEPYATGRFKTVSISVNQKPVRQFLQISGPAHRILTRNLCIDNTCHSNGERSAADEEITKTRRKIPSTADDVKKIFMLYPKPKYSLNQIFTTLASYFKDDSYKISPIFKSQKLSQGKVHWECTYNLKWPQELKFSVYGVTKQDASTKTALLALQHLYVNGNIKQDTPILAEQLAEIENAKNKLDVLEFKSEIQDLMKGIVDDYDTKLAEHLSKYTNQEQNEPSSKEESEGAEEIWPFYSDIHRVPKFKGVDYYSIKEVVELPISNFKEQIINTVESNRVVVIKGEPGCGKSTRVPQYILEGWAKSFQTSGKNCRIIVTQPRRIAAISLAERVASERQEHAGPTVGYQVRLKSNFNRHTGKILYCTTGILLRRLQSDPTLTDCTHVILDEAHERDVNTDLLMNLLKHALHVNTNLKLMIMSATIKAEVFQQYFNDAAVVHVPGFTYPVTVHYLDDKTGPAARMKMTSGETPNVVYEDVAKLLHLIHHKKPEGAILVFLPGWDDIIRVKKLLPEDKGDVKVLCLHSRMPDSEQRVIFHRFPPGVRKIILATNIAETSVTIDDVVYVVDSGIQKEQRFDVEKGINIIDNHWISKASMAQRKGRAGRVQAGEAFLMYPRTKYEEFADYSVPEIQRTSLTKIVLDSKVYSNNMSASEFLGQLITPPEESATERAVDELTELDLLDEKENLTPLGRVISDFQLEPKLAKALVNSVIYKCVTPVVDIITLYSAEIELFSTGLGDKERVNKTKRSFSSSSDHLSMMRLMEQWLDYAENSDDYKASAFCRTHNILDYKLRTLQQLRDIHFDYLHKGLHDILPLSDDFSDSDELVKAVLLSGVGTVLQHRDYDFVKGKMKKKNVLLTRHNHKATISSASVNHKRGRFPSNYMLYINETRSNIRRITVIRETSLITPLTVLLFKNNPIIIQQLKSSQLTGEMNSLKNPVIVRLDGTQIIFVTEKEQAELLKRCKEALTSGVDYYIYQLTKGAEYDRHINRVWDGILKRLNNALKSEASLIEF